MKYAITVFFALWMIIMWAAVIYAFRMGWQSFKKDYRGEKSRIKARVVGKNEHTVFVAQTHKYDQVYEITFECQDGTSVVFHVPERLFLHVSEGENGILVRKGERFIAFEGPSGAAEGADDLYRRLIRR